jgi:hypothetical protein
VTFRPYRRAAARLPIFPALALSAVLMVAGCSSPTHEPTAMSTTPALTPPSPAATSSDPLDEVSRAVAAYRSMWDAYVAASNAGQTEPSDLALYAAGDALETLNRGLALNKSNAVVSKGAPKLAPHLSSLTPSTAPTKVTLGDCLDDSHWLLYKADGHLADNVPGGRRTVGATIEKQRDGWKVTSFAVKGVGTC